jgi:hypothetical protein
MIDACGQTLALLLEQRDWWVATQLAHCRAKYYGVNPGVRQIDHVLE